MACRVGWDGNSGSNQKTAIFGSPFCCLEFEKIEACDLLIFD
jgi:hypothetical protein